MPLTKTEIDKRWRINKPDVYHAKQKRYYDKNPEKVKARVLRFRLYKSEVKRFMNILLE